MFAAAAPFQEPRVPQVGSCLPHVRIRGGSIPPPCHPASGFEQSAHSSGFSPTRLRPANRAAEGPAGADIQFSKLSCRRSRDCLVSSVSALGFRLCLEGVALSSRFVEGAAAAACAHALGSSWACPGSFLSLFAASSATG